MNGIPGVFTDIAKLKASSMAAAAPAAAQAAYLAISADTGFLQGRLSSIEKHVEEDVERLADIEGDHKSAFLKRIGDLLRTKPGSSTDRTPLQPESKAS